MRQTIFTSMRAAARRLLAVTLVLTLCAAAAVAIAETVNTASEKHFTLEAATREISQDPDRPALTIKEIAKAVRPAVVSIATEGTVSSSYGQLPYDIFGYGYGYGNRRQAPIRRSGAGSGIVISSDGYILTNAHVVTDADTIKVQLSDGKEYDAIVVGVDEINDVAVIKIEAKDLSVAVFGDSDQLEIGELAVAIGNPLGESHGSVTAGIISALASTITIDGNDMTLLQTDAAINPGNSGGALVNSFGEIIGIVNAKAASLTVEGIGYAIPVNQVRQLIEDIVNGKGVTQAASKGMMLGVTVRDVDAQTAQQYRVPEGVYVVDVEAFSAAEKAGIKGGDTLVSLAGKPVKTVEELNSVKADLEPGIPQDIVVLRDGKEVKLSVTLTSGEQPTL
ncbi:MAG: trypsin-like peptidase domain-containing protein [Oscillospiraceae bacterium]|jgi:serine protease Do|nr:trypsin-like peptidase domain-containing protein [Oscillospiraceae bacterium]